MDCSHLNPYRVSISLLDTIVTPFALDTLSSYLSLLPQPADAVLQLGPMDYLMASAPNYAPSRLFNLYPHPAQDPSEKRKYIVALTSRYYLLCVCLGHVS